VTNIFIPPLYWILVYKPNLHAIDYYNVSSHGISAFLLILDVLFENYSIIWIDFIIVVTYCYGYIGWIYLYHLLTGLWIYAAFDPKKVASSVIILNNIVISISLFIGYFIIKFFMWLKLIIFGLIKRKFQNLLWKVEEETLTMDENGINEREEEPLI
jgi:hypothetical protein